jgi:Family of unknown function (DUF6152)
LGLALPTAVLAHHGWGSYDAAHPITVAGPIEPLKYEIPHALIRVKAADNKVWPSRWPTSRMPSRGAPPEFVAVGKKVSAYG